MALRQAAGASSRFCSGIRGGSEFERDVGTFGGGHVHSVVKDDVGAEEGKGGAVHGEFAEDHGLVVTLPVVLAFGDALEGAAGVGDFGVEVLEEDFSDGHVGSFCTDRRISQGFRPE